MSRSKSFYQGISLGKVRRSEYEDSNLRDNGRQEARLMEDLKTVDRARNVMKKSMEADKHMLIKTGLPMPRKMPLTSHGAHPHPESKPPPHQAKTGADARVKRFSVTEMPSDLDRTRHYRKKSTARPPSYHDQMTNSPINKEFSYSHDKLLESRTSGTHVEGKNYSTQQADAAAALGVSERLRRSEPTMSPELEQQGVVSFNRSTMYTAQVSRHEKGMPVNNASISESHLHLQGDTGGTSVKGPHRGKPDQHSKENGEDSKDINCEQSESKDQELKLRKKATIWETLSTPKYTSLTKSKRSQIEQEFTASRLKSYRSSPALISNAKVKPQVLPGQGKPPLKENPSSQGRKIDESKVKNAASTRSRID